MKQIINNLWMVLLALATLASCSDDEQVTEVEPTFPECQTGTIRPDETRVIQFDADRAWQLTSDRQWLKLKDADGLFQSLTGKAGAQSVQVVATDGAQGFADDEAELQLLMGGEQAVIAHFTRPARERIQRMFTLDGKEAVQVEEFIDNSFNRIDYVGFEANYDWTLDMESLPEWLIDNRGGRSEFAHLCGEAGQPTSISRMTGLDVMLAERYRDLQGYITIRSLSDGYTHQFPIQAPGIAPKKIYWLGSTTTLGGGLLWNGAGVRLQKAPGSGELSETDEPAVCSALVRDHLYTTHLVEWDSEQGAAVELPAEEAWAMVAQRDGGELTLEVKANKERAGRKAVLFVVPADTLIDYNTQFDEQTGAFLFSQTGYGIALEQMGFAGGFDVLKKINSMTNELMEGVIASPDAEDIAAKLHLSKVDNIFERTFTAEEWNLPNAYNIKPVGLTDQVDSYELFDSSFQSLGTTPTGWASVPFGIGNVYDENWVGTRAVTISSRLPFDQIADSCLYIVFHYGDKELGTFVIRKAVNQ